VAESFVIDHERALSDPDGLASVAVNGDREDTGRTDHQVIEGQRVVARCDVATDRHRMHNGPLVPERGEGICKSNLGECSTVGAPRITRERIDSEEARDQRNGRSLCLQCKALPQGVVRWKPACRGVRVSRLALRRRQRRTIIPRGYDSVPQR